MSKKTWQPDLVLFLLGAQVLLFCAVMLIVNLLHQKGVPGFKGEEDFGAVLAATLAFQGMTWILIPIFLRLHDSNWREVFGLRSANALRSVALAVAALAVVLPVALLLETGCEWTMKRMDWHPKPQEAVQLLNDTSFWPTGFYIGFFAIVLAPVAEEFIFRGVLFSFVKQAGYPRIAWIGVSLLFAFIHGASVIFIPLFVLALALTWLYEKTDNLLAPIIAHSLFNTINLAIFYLGGHQAT